MEQLIHKKIELLPLLIREVEETFGRRITTSRDCIQLSEEIYFKTTYKINSNTLRRFFGLVKASYPPSSATLHILSTYCGLSSVDDLISLHSSKDKEPGACNDEFLNYLIALFKSVNVKEEGDETFLAVVKQTILFLRRQPDLAHPFQRAIAKTKNGQDFYFEHFINIDQLNGFYGDGLRFYLAQKKTTEAQMFGYSLLCFRAWLTQDTAGMKKNFEEIRKLKTTKNMQPLVWGMYYSSHLYYAEQNGLGVERILQDAHHTHLALKPKNDIYSQFPGFEYIFSMALLLTDHYQEALYYVNHALKNNPMRHSSDQCFHKTLQLLKGMALVRMGDREWADEIFTQIRPSQFYFLSKKTNTILYLLLAKYLRKKNPRPDEELEKLITETGFTKIRSIAVL